MFGALIAKASGFLSMGKVIALAAAAATLAGGVLYIKALRADVSRLETERAALVHDLSEAVATNDANLAAMASMQQAANERIAALQREREALAKRAARVRIIYREIDHATEADDGPVAPVLARTLDRLREAGTAAAGGDENSAGADGRSAGPAALRPGAAGPGR